MNFPPYKEVGFFWYPLLTTLQVYEHKDRMTAKWKLQVTVENISCPVSDIPNSQHKNKLNLHILQAVKTDWVFLHPVIPTENLTNYATTSWKIFFYLSGPQFSRCQKKFKILKRITPFEWDEHRMNKIDWTSFSFTPLHLRVANHKNIAILSISFIEKRQFLKSISEEQRKTCLYLYNTGWNSG